MDIDQARESLDQHGYWVLPTLLSAQETARGIGLIDAARDRQQHYHSLEEIESAGAQPNDESTDLLWMFYESGLDDLMTGLGVPASYLPEGCDSASSETQRLSPENPWLPTPHLDARPVRPGADEAGGLKLFPFVIGFNLTDNSTPLSGNLLVWPESHRKCEEWFATHTPGDYFGHTGEPPLFFVPPRVTDGLDCFALMVPPGSVVVFNGALVHSSSANRTGVSRYAVYFRAGAQYDAFTDGPAPPS